MSDGIRPALEQVPWLPKAKGLAERIQQASANSHLDLVVPMTVNDDPEKVLDVLRVAFGATEDELVAYLRNVDPFIARQMLNLCEYVGRCEEIRVEQDRLADMKRRRDEPWDGVWR
jgi:hypothetical protein